MTDNLLLYVETEDFVKELGSLVMSKAFPIVVSLHLDASVVLSGTRTEREDVLG